MAHPTALWENQSMRQKELSDYTTIGQSGPVGDTTCPTCGRSDFASRRGVKLHHSRTHGESIAGTLVNCEWCGEEEYVGKRRAENNDNVFCSKSCHGEWMEKHQHGEDHPLWTERVKMECVVCGGEYEVIPSRVENSNCCSAACRGELVSELNGGENHHSWSRTTYECKQCGGEFSVPECESYRLFCGQDCSAEWYSENNYGPAHPLWKGGEKLSEALRKSLGPKSWSSIRSDVVEGCDNTCKMCGERPPRRNVDVHHIIPVNSGGTNGEWCLMPLCQKCHKKAEWFIRRHTEFSIVDLIPDQESSPNT